MHALHEPYAHLYVGDYFADTLDLSARSGDGQFLIGQIDQIHKLDRVSEVTSIGVFWQGCLHQEGRSFRR